MEALFAQPLALLALAGVPLVLALHLFRRRYAPRQVSALFLWGRDDQNLALGRSRERLRKTTSLCCELLAALVLALALAGPRACGSQKSEHIVAVLDGSACLQARWAQEPGAPSSSVLQRLRAELRQRIEAAGATVRVSLIESGTRPRLLAGPAALAQEALAALEHWEPEGRTHSFDAALTLARELAGEGVITLYTDRAPAQALPAAVGLVALGRAQDNLGILCAERFFESGPAPTERIVLVLQAFAQQAQSARLELWAGEQRVFERELVLRPGQEQRIEWPLPEETPMLEARLVSAAADALAQDDRAYLAPASRRELLLWVEGEAGDLAALGLPSNGLQANSAAAAWAALVPRARPADSAAAAHLLLGPPAAGGAGSWALELAPLGEERRALLGPFPAELAQPLLEGVSFGGVIWTLDPTLALGGLALISSGSHALLSETRDGARRCFTLNLDPQRSTVGRSTDWAILLANLAELRRAELPGPERCTLSAGERLRARALQPGLWELLGGATQLAFEAGEELELEVPQRAGFYELRQAGEFMANIGVSLVDARQSDLSPARELRLPADGPPADVPAQQPWIGSGLLALALCALLLDWWVLGARS